MKEKKVNMCGHTDVPHFGRNKCHHCYDQWWKENNKEKRRVRQNAYRAANPEVRRASDRARWAKDSTHQREQQNDWRNRHRLESDLKCKYGINIAEYTARLEEQGGVCAICKETCPLRPRLCVDHDHDSPTMHIRGLLCDRCNVSIGGLKHSPEILRAAADYLERTKKKVA